MNRKSIPDGIETAVLLRSARRCTLCFHLKGDLSEKKGQIAHLDKNPSNSTEDNLAFLCLDHHTLFDSKTSQHKNYTIHEVKAARANLYGAIAQKKHLGDRASTLPGPPDEPLVSWQHFNYQRSLEAGGGELYDDLILGNFISHSVHAPCSVRGVIEQIAQHSAKPIPIESLADCLSQPVLPRGQVLFGCPGTCVDEVVGNYDNLEWWISSKGTEYLDWELAIDSREFGCRARLKRRIADEWRLTPRYRTGRTGSTAPSAQSQVAAITPGGHSGGPSAHTRRAVLFYSRSVV